MRWGKQGSHATRPQGGLETDAPDAPEGGIQSRIG